MPRFDLLACRAAVQWFRVLDKGVILIPEGRKGQGFCHIDSDLLEGVTQLPTAVPSWIMDLKT